MVVDRAVRTASSDRRLGSSSAWPVSMIAEWMSSWRPDVGGGRRRLCRPFAHRAPRSRYWIVSGPCPQPNGVTGRRGCQERRLMWGSIPTKVGPWPTATNGEWVAVTFDGSRKLDSALSFATRNSCARTRSRPHQLAEVISDQCAPGDGSPPLTCARWRAA